MFVFSISLILVRYTASLTAFVLFRLSMLGTLGLNRVQLGRLRWSWKEVNDQQTFLVSFW